MKRQADRMQARVRGDRTKPTDARNQVQTMQSFFQSKRAGNKFRTDVGELKTQKENNEQFLQEAAQTYENRDSRREANEDIVEIDQKIAALKLKYAQQRNNNQKGVHTNMLSNVSQPSVAPNFNHVK